VFGTDFFNVSSVSFGGTTATGVITDASGTFLTVDAPAHAAGKVDVLVTNSTGTSSVSQPADQYNYSVAPTVSSISPTSGPSTGATPVTITGSGFTDCEANPGDCSVTFDGISVTFTATGDSVITTSSPPHAAGAVNVVVTTLGGPATAPQQFNYTAVQPTVTSIVDFTSDTATGTPNGGETVEVMGAAFFGVTTVKFGNSVLSPIFVSSDGTLLEVTTPAGANDSTVDVTVTAEGGTSATTTADQFTWLAPIIREFRLSGPSGPGDQYVELYNPSTTVSLPLYTYSLGYYGDSGTSISLFGGTLAPRQAYLIAGPSYSLDPVSGSEDQTLSTAIPEIASTPGTGGLAIIDTNGKSLEAVGFAGATGFTAGTPLTSPASPNDDYTFARAEYNGAPIDTGNNASDFQLRDPGAAMTGSVDGVPAPASSTSPAWNNLESWSTLIDTSVSSSTSPNMSYDSGTQTLTIDRTIENCSGGTAPCPTSSPTTFNSMYLYISTMSVTGQNVTGQAQLDVQNSTGATVTTTCCGSVVAQALTMVQSDGGGVGTLLQVPLPGGSLAPGATVSVIISLHVNAPGHFFFGYDVLTS
jgi:large repetitive protein